MTNILPHYTELWYGDVNVITWYVIVLQVHTRKRQEKQAEEAAAQIPRGTNITSSFCVECFCQAYLRLMLTCNFTCSQKTSRRLSMWRSLHSTCSMEYRQRGRSSLQVHMEPTNICFLRISVHTYRNHNSTWWDDGSDVWCKSTQKFQDSNWRLEYLVICLSPAPLTQLVTW